MKKQYERRVASLEALMLGGQPEPAEIVASRFLDGTFTGTIQDGDGLRVHITRPLTFNRDNDGSWLIFSYDPASGDRDHCVHVLDPLACDAMDALFELTANPDDYPGARIEDATD